MALKFANNNSLSAITSVPSGVGGGSLNLISTQTASSSATIDFTSGIDSTYKEYIFKFINIHPATDAADFKVGFRDGSTAYDATKTTTFFQSNHEEDGTNGALGYVTGNDLAQSTSSQILIQQNGNGNDECISGELKLFDPSSTTFVKHFIARSTGNIAYDYCYDVFVAGYCNTTTAIDGVQFSMSSGNIDSGTIKLYGVS